MRKNLTPVVIVALVLFFRIPAMVADFELNPDESQMMAQAMRFASDIVPWRSVDGTTSGPVNSWFLLAAHAAGVPLRHRWVHLLGALCLALAVTAGFWVARRYFGDLPAKIAALSAIVWVATHQQADLIQYSSELISLVLIPLALAVSAASPIFAAVLLGIVPWAKLQAAPVAAVAGLWLIRELANKREWKRVAAMIVAALVPSIGILGVVIGGGAWNAFIQSYLTANIFYTGNKGFFAVVADAVRTQPREGGLPWLIILAGIWLWKRPRLTDRSGFAWLLVLVVVYACFKPEMVFLHHQILMLVPLMLLTAATASAVPAKRPLAMTALFVLAYLATQGPAVSRAKAILTRDESIVEASRVVAACEAVSPGCESVLVWGWHPSVYVALQQAPPTRHAIPHFLYTANPSVDALRATFMQDLAASRPKLILELIGPLDYAFTPKPEFFPALDQYVREHYTLKWSGKIPIDDAEDSLRIYERR